MKATTTTRPLEVTPRPENGGDGPTADETRRDYRAPSLRLLGTAEGLLEILGPAQANCGGLMQARPHSSDTKRRATPIHRDWGGCALTPMSEDDIRSAVDLGLVRWNGGLEIANPIYREVIPQALTSTVRADLPPLDPVWLRPDGRLGVEAWLSWTPSPRPL